MARGEPPRVNSIVGGQTANHQAVEVGVATAMTWDIGVVKERDGGGQTANGQHRCRVKAPAVEPPLMILTCSSVVWFVCETLSARCHINSNS